MRTLSVLLVSMALSLSAFALEGKYTSPLGEIKLKDVKGEVTATSMGGGPCSYKKGAVVFTGSILDDSLTGEVNTCKVGKGCSGKASGMIMLLISQEGKLLSGAVHTDAGKCATPIKNDAITFQKKLKVASTTKGKRPPGPKGIRVTDGSDKEPKGGTKPKNITPKNGGLPTGPVKAGDRQQAEAKATEALPDLEKGRFEAARTLLKAAVEIDPSYDQGYNLVGATYAARDRYDDALEWYKRALEINPANHDVYYNMACVYALKGEKEKAIRYLQISILNGYVDLGTIQGDEDLRALEGNSAFEKLKKGEF